MLREPLALLSVYSLWCGLSCAVWTPPPFQPQPLRLSDPSPVDRSPLGPGAIEWVEARFLRYQTGLAAFEVRAVAETIVESSEALGIERDLVLAVIHTESGFHAFARSRVGALGLMQIMPETGEMLAEELGLSWEGPETLFDPTVNVRMGIHYLAFLYEKYGSWERALAAYNWGPMRIDRRLRAGAPLPERYVAKVTGHLQTPRLH